MTTVYMLQQLSGARYDGQPWPQDGGPIDVPDWEAAELVAAGIAEYQPDDPPPPGPPDIGEPAALGGEPVAADEAAPAPGEPAKPPAVNAPKAEWIDHAIAQGHDPAEAQTMTKAALIEQYGATT